MRNVRKNFNFFVDGKGFAGQVESFTAPKLTLKEEDFQGGGMFGPTGITMGHEKLTAGAVLLCDDPDIMSKFSVVEGGTYQFTAREQLESSDGTVTAVVHSMRGKVSEIDRGESKPGEKATTTLALSLNYYKLTHGARVVQEVDVLNMVWVQDGVDALAAARAALGI